MKHSPDLDRSVVKRPIRQEVTGMLHLLDGPLDPVAAEPRMVGSRRERKLGADVATATAGEFRNVDDGTR